jgi:class 3 adenylate cyclase
MYLLKKLIVKSFSSVVTVLGRVSMACAVFVLGAQCLGQLHDLKSYTILQNIFDIEQYLEKPVVNLLHANVPTVFGGVECAPYAIFLVFFALWAACEMERHRLAVHVWELTSEQKAAEVRKNAERAEKEAVLAARLAEKEAIEAARKAQKEAEALAKARAEEITRQERARQAAEEYSRQAQSPQPAPAPLHVPKAPHIPAIPAEGSNREQLLELYAQTKKTLEESKKNLSFLAVDVVNSTGMKLGEDAALSERDFRQYKKLVERVITANKGLKAAWTPDGVMICFASVQNAVQAAQDLIRSLDHFNRTVKAIKADFKVRCGINAGKVLFDDAVPMEEMTDRHIDIAGHMQKYAEANTIYVGAHAIEGMRAQFGFRSAQKQVDGCDVYEWRADGSSESQPVPVG